MPGWDCFVKILSEVMNDPSLYRSRISFQNYQNISKHMNINLKPATIWTNSEPSCWTQKGRTLKCYNIDFNVPNTAKQRLEKSDGHG